MCGLVDKIPNQFNKMSHNHTQGREKIQEHENILSSSSSSATEVSGWVCVFFLESRRFISSSENHNMTCWHVSFFQGLFPIIYKTSWDRHWDSCLSFCHTFQVQYFCFFAKINVFWEHQIILDSSGKIGARIFSGYWPLEILAHILCV